MTLSDKLKTLRASKGYSQENMAGLLQISSTAYAKIERGETDVCYSRLEQIAGVFKLTMFQLVNIGEDDLNILARSPKNEGIDILAENEKLKTENDGLKKQVALLNKIIDLLEGLK
jgi:XRE family transcriptional regulator, regulator of sulfur utilization